MQEEDLMLSLRHVRLRHPRPLALAWTALTCSLAAGALTGCGGGGGGSANTATPTSPNTASFSGSPPSALVSSASSARASASAAASSASARASEFEASVSAESARREATAEKKLKGVKGRGNALSEVGMSGLPKARTGGVLAVLVNITNKTDRKASYAVQIDFEDSKHHVVETRYTGAENVEPGQKQQPVVFSRRPPEENLTPRLAKAQRY